LRHGYPSLRVVFVALACLRVGLRVTCVRFAVSCVGPVCPGVSEFVCRVSGIVCRVPGFAVSCVAPSRVSRCRAAGAGGVRGADLKVRGRTGFLFVSGPRTLPGVRPESDPELCFLTGKGRVRAGSPGSELRTPGVSCELRPQRTGVRQYPRT
jgi:hypothetical protein